MKDRAEQRRNPSWPYDDVDDDDFEDAYADEDPLARDGFGCFFPEECIAPDPYHFPSECHTAEMMEALYAESDAEVETEANAEPEGHGDAERTRPEPGAELPPDDGIPF